MNHQPELLVIYLTDSSDSEEEEEDSEEEEEAPVAPPAEVIAIDQFRHIWRGTNWRTQFQAPYVIDGILLERNLLDYILYDPLSQYRSFSLTFAAYQQLLNAQQQEGGEPTFSWESIEGEYESLAGYEYDTEGAGEDSREA